MATVFSHNCSKILSRYKKTAPPIGKDGFVKKRVGFQLSSDNAKSVPFTTSKKFVPSLLPDAKEVSLLIF